MTSITAVPALLAFPLVVRAAVRLSPGFVRVTLAGASLVDFHRGGPLGGRDQLVKLQLPAVGSPAPELGDLSPGWYLRWRASPPEVRGHLRTYTVRAARLDGPDPQLDLDFVLHDHTGSPGPGSTWARQARPGDRVTILGPNARCTAPAGIEWQPPPATPQAPVRVLLAGDETAVPAISSVVESLPAGYRGHAVLEVGCAADFAHLTTGGADLEVRWLARGGSPHGQRLREAVRSLLVSSPPSTSTRPDQEPMAEVDVDAEVLWDTPAFLGLDQARTSRGFYAWIAGEAATVRDLRWMLVSEHAVDRGSVAFMGYWRHGRPELC